LSVAAFALVLFGCSDDGTACQRLATPAATYTSSAQCNAHVEEALESPGATRADYPSVISLCLSSRIASRMVTGTFDLTRADLRQSEITSQ